MAKRPKKPFEEKDVLYRYTPPGLGEVVFAKSGPSNVYSVQMFYRTRNLWQCTSPGMRDIEELLQQLQAALAENTELRRSIEQDNILKDALRREGR